MKRHNSRQPHTIAGRTTAHGGHTNNHNGEVKTPQLTTKGNIQSIWVTICFMILIVGVDWYFVDYFNSFLLYFGVLS